MPELAIIVPTRGRPGNIEKVISAWDFTNAWDVADLVLAVDADDPEIGGYRELLEGTRHPDTDEALFQLVEYPVWQPMVPKLNATAVALAGQYFALGFAGDDHLPRTINWAQRYLTVLRELGTGMVYGDDGYQGARLSTEWAVTSDVTRTLGRMVPADVEHMYSDTSLLELMASAGLVRHLPEVRIEHMHPVAGKSDNDDQYRKVNSTDQFNRDRASYNRWQRDEKLTQLDMLRALAPGRQAPVPAPVRRTPVVNRSRRVTRSEPTAKRRARAQEATRTSLVPKTFRNVRGATPDEIGVTLADFAVKVPGDQAIVELGVFQGRTALLLAWGAEQGNGAHVWGVDAWELADNTYGAPFKTADSRNWANYNVKATGYADKVTLIHGFSLDQADQWSGPPIGLLFVDGDHSYQGAQEDILRWARHLAPGAVIAVDDHGHPDWPGVEQAVSALVSEGVIAAPQIYHERLAVTRLLDPVTEPGKVIDQFLQPANTDVPPPTQNIGVLVQDGELSDAPGGTPIEDLGVFQLRALAKVRGIKLGARKDKRDAMLDALKSGQ